MLISNKIRFQFVFLVTYPELKSFSLVDCNHDRVRSGSVPLSRNITHHASHGHGCVYRDRRRHLYILLKNLCGGGDNDTGESVEKHNKHQQLVVFLVEFPDDLLI